MPARIGRLEMISVVIDTNVIISAALSPKGKPAEIINVILSEDDIKIIYTEKIFNEYKKVLAYERLKINYKTQKRILDKIREIGISIEPVPSNVYMPDESDRIFYDTARDGGAILITGNARHFPSEPFVMSPFDSFDKIIKK